jgi:carbonic anhydrase
MFDDLLAANQRYAQTFAYGELDAPAAKRFALVTCIDSRLEPLPMLGLVPGDAKIVRNAGGRVNDEALRSLVLATNLLDVDRVAVMQHTRCAVASKSQEEFAAAVSEAAGHDASGWDFQAIGDQEEVLRADVEKVRACPLVPDRVTVAGWLYDVRTGRISEIC